MQTTIRTMQTLDIPEVVKGWNISLPYDNVNEKRFIQVILNDPNHTEGDTLVAIHGGEIAGFISVIAREGISGADNRGRAYEKSHGFIKGFYVLEKYRRNDIGSKLLDEATRYLISKEKSIIRVITYAGHYFFPGVDLRYESALRFFESKDFKQDHIIDDVHIDISDFKISEIHENARRKMAAIGVCVEDYDPAMLNQMREFAKKLDMISWFPEGWEKWFKHKGNKVVALKGDDIVGWASFGVDGKTGMFGPTGVLKNIRHNGIGSCILLESVLRMKDAGADRVVALWANTPFYIANGWKICRQYAVFEKNIIS